MKNSGIEWIEGLPDSWQEIPNRYLFIDHSTKVGENWKDYQLLSLTTSGVKEKDVGAGGGKVPDSYENYQTVEIGDMIFCLFDLDCSAVFAGLSNYNGMITSAYDVFMPNSKYLKNLYADYWFQYVFSNRYYKMYSKNIRYTVTTEMFKSILTPIPPLDEQRKIGEFLLEKDKLIAELIANQQGQIEKLKEYKQSVITEAVTKGLDKSTPLKDSGIEWIGEIPESWDIQKIKFHIQVNNEKISNLNLPYIALEHVEGFSGKLIETDSVYDVTDAIVADKGDVLFGKLRPYLAKVYLVQDKSYVSSEFAVFNTNTISNRYLKWFMLGYGFLDTVNASTYGTKMPRANIDFIKNLYIPIFNLSEQEYISDYLDEKCGKIDRLIAIKQEKIEKLQEYKKSLIYEYVTGKKEMG